MKIVQVTYTTRPEYAETNSGKISLVMAELRSHNYRQINYNVCVNKEGTTFVHTAFFENDEDQQILGALTSFQNFQSELQKSQLIMPPEQVELTLIGSSQDIFTQL
jgi:hypothetical protein